MSCLNTNSIVKVWYCDVFQCSVTCGEGLRHRKVLCYIGEEEVIESQCDYKQQPVSRIPCYMATCPRWITKAWEEVGAV